MSNRDVEIIDSQVHIWGADTPQRPWITTYAHKPHGPAELPAKEVIAELDRAGVTGAVIVPPSFEGDRNDLALAACEDHPGRFAVLGRFDVSQPENRDAILRGLEPAGMLGIRLTFNAAASEWLRDGTLDWFWDFAEGAAIPVTMYPNSSTDLESIESIAKQHIALKMSIDHCGTGTDPATLDSMQPLHRLAPLGKLGNVAVKVSALPISFPTTYSPAVVRAVVGLLLDSFGPDRLFWGSDYTRAPAAHSDYARTVTTFLEGIAHFDPAAVRRIMGESLREWFGWKR